MTGRRRHAPRQRTLAELVAELNEHEKWNEDRKLKERMIPDAWHAMDELAPLSPTLTRINLPLDADLVAWLRALGPERTPRITAVLRAYMLAVRCKEIEGRFDRDWKGDPI
jgi:uncharacterized protein (DUF4415 family)